VPQRVQIGQGHFTYEPKADWVQRPPGTSWLEVVGVAIDSHGRVFVFNRGDHPVMIFQQDGRFLCSWGEGQFDRPHGITIGLDDAVYCTDDFGHTIQKFTPDGKLLLRLGTRGQASNTGATSIDFRTIRYSGKPFHFPTNVALSADGSIYVTDGYGNARVHKFSPAGELLFSWGTPGDEPGQFGVPHGIAIDKAGMIFVADRENNRIQIFSPDGQFLREMRELARPSQVTFDAVGNLFVAELGFRAGMWPGTFPPTQDATGGRVTIFDPKGTLLARFGGGENPTAPGDFFAPHDICVDSHGDVYVAEVVMSAGGNCGLVSPDCHTLQKLCMCTRAQN
jgi:DNA-binding beta-propeller fold protein YncE